MSAVTEPSDLKQLQTAVIEWGRGYYQTEDIVAYIFPDDGDDPDRYIATLAVRGLDSWQAAEVWVGEDDIIVINELGEGVPSDDVAWPWSD